MASINKRGKKWLVEVRRKGYYKAKRFETKLEAEAWAVEQEQRITQPGVVKGVLFSDALKRYSEEISPTKKGKRWEQIRLQKISRSFLGELPLCDLTTDDLQRWIQESLKTISAASLNRELNLISGVLSVARKQWKWLDRNLCKDLMRPKNPKPRDRRLSEHEINRILIALEFDSTQMPEQLTGRQEIAIAFLLAIETAMRQGELWKLDWADIFLSQNYLKLHDTKNGSPRDVPLSERAIELFQHLTPNLTGPVFKINQASAGTIFRRAVQLAGIEDLTFHDTRHEALTRLARKLDVLDLARMVGHRDPRSLMIYYNPTASEIAQRLG